MKPNRFLKACRNGWLEMVKSQVESSGGISAAIGVTNSVGNHGLHQASRAGRTEVVEYLLSLGWPVDQPGNNGYTALHLAAQNGHEATCDALLKGGAGIDRKDNDSNMVIHHASYGGFVDVVTSLLQAGANLDDRGEMGCTPLHCALLCQHADLVHFLVSKGADFMAKDVTGMSPLMLAKERNKELYKVLKQTYRSYFFRCCFEGDIAALKKEVTSRGGIKELVEMKSASGKDGLQVASLGGKDEVVTYLLSVGWPVKEKGGDGMTALHYAADAGHLSVCRILIIRGAEVDAKNDAGNSAVHVAALKGHNDVVNILVGMGANLEDRGSNGRTPLHIAAATGNVTLTRRLLTRGSQRTAKDDSGATPLDLAKVKGCSGVIHMLDVDADLFLSSCCKGVKDSVGQILENSGCIKYLLRMKDECGNSGLHLAVQHKRTEIVKLLLESDWPLDKPNAACQTPLHCAARIGHDAVCKLLVDQGANVDLKNRDGNGSIHLATIGGHLTVVKFFCELEAGKKLINSTGALGYTPLHIAAVADDIPRARLLLSMGANLLAKDNRGKTPMNLAKEAGESDMNKYLIDELNVSFFQPCLEGNLKMVTQMVERVGEIGELVTLRCAMGESGIHLAAMRGNLDVVSYFLQMGWPVDDLHGESMRTALHYAAENGHATTCNALLRSGASVGAKDATGQSALHLASTGGHLKVLNLLMEKGARIEDRDMQGRTVLHRSAIRGNVQLSRHLLAKGAQQEAKDNELYTPLDLARLSGKTECVTLLQVNTQAFLSACTEGMTSTALGILQKAGGTEWLMRVKQDDGNSGIHLAVKHKRWCIATILVGKGWPVNQKGERDQTILHWAAGEGNIPALKLLIDNGACVDTRDGNGDRPIHFAAKNGHANAVEVLLKGSDVDVPGAFEWTPLHYAAIWRKVEVACLLLSKGADPAAKNQLGKTPLELAECQGDTSMIKLMKKVYQTHFLRCCAEGNLEAVEKGLANRGGANGLTNWRGDSGKSGIHMAALKGRSEVVKCMLRWKWPVDQQETRNRVTALHCAARNGHYDTCLVLLESGANVWAKSSYNDFPIHMASFGGHIKVVDILLMNGASLSDEGKGGRTPLHNAAIGGHVELVQHLLDIGANQMALDGNKKSPLDVARAFNNVQVMRLLEVNPQEFVLHCMRGDLPMVHKLSKLAGGLKWLIQSRDSDGDTGLHLAARYGRRNVFTFLLNAGWPIDHIGGNGFTPLHCAAATGQQAICKILIEKGADVHAKAATGFSAIHSAVMADHLSVVELLLQSGVDVNVQGAHDWTPLHCASTLGKAGACRLLLSKGASLSAQDEKGRTPVGLAEGAGDKETIRLLREHAIMELGATSDSEEIASSNDMSSGSDDEVQFVRACNPNSVNVDLVDCDDDM